MQFSDTYRSWRSKLTTTDNFDFGVKEALKKINNDLEAFGKQPSRSRDQIFCGSRMWVSSLGAGTN